MGDIIEWNEQHMMLKLAGHAAVITKNLLAAINGTANAKPAEYQSGKEAILITRGPVSPALSLVWFSFLFFWLQLFFVHTR